MKSTLGAAQERWIYSTPAVQGNLAVCGNSAVLAGYGAEGGHQRWTNNFGNDWAASYGSPSLAGPLVLMGGMWLANKKLDSSIYALDAQTGMHKWSIESRGIHGCVSIAPGVGFAVDVSGKLHAIDLEGGKLSASMDLEKGWSMSTPAVSPDLLVVPTGAGTVHGFNPRTLEHTWKFTAGKSIWNMSPYDATRKAVFSSPTITADAVFIGCSDGHLYALDKQSGQPRWKYNFGVPTLSTPCVSGNTLFTAAYDGNVYAFTSR
jgi:outer membrane protein assembly factor BamB